MEQMSPGGGPVDVSAGPAFNVEHLLRAHYLCEYDFAKAPVYGFKLDHTAAEGYLSGPMPAVDLNFDPGVFAVLFQAAKRTGRTEFLDRAAGMLAALYALPNWRYGHHQHMSQVDLGMAVVSARLGHVYEYMAGLGYDDMRHRVAEQIIAKGLEPFYEQVTNPQRHGWARMYMNWRSYICADMGRAAFRLAGVYSRWRECVAEAIRGCIAVADTACLDGGWEEGVGYWGMAFGQTANLAEELYAASGGRVDLFAHPSFRVAGDFGLYCSMPGHCATYAFSDWPVRRPRRDLMQSLAWHFQNSYWQWCADQSDEKLPTLYGPPPKPLSPDPLPPCKHFRGLDVAILRTGWSAQDVVVGFKCGPRRIQTHQHLDANSFVVYNGPDPVLDEVNDCEPEDCASLYAQLGNETDKTVADAALGSASTVAHSTLLADGQGQLQGKDEWGQIKPIYRTRKTPLNHGELLPRDCTARIIGFGQPPGIPFVIGEAADSYPFAVKSFQRSVAIAPPRVLVIADRVSCAPGTVISTLLHPAGEVEQVGPDTFHIRVGSGTVPLAIDIISSTASEPTLRTLRWSLTSGAERWVVAGEVAVPGDWLWIVYTLALSGTEGAKLAVPQFGADRLTLRSPGWSQQLQIVAGRWSAVNWQTPVGQ